jgi:hypothetical protein
MEEQKNCQRPHLGVLGGGVHLPRGCVELPGSAINNAYVIGLKSRGLQSRVLRTKSCMLILRYNIICLYEINNNEEYMHIEQVMPISNRLIARFYCSQIERECDGIR